MMATGKECVKRQSNPVPECCMCGDQGISIELFNCKVCQFRYQHRYCSNLYPKADTKVCNWCLYEKNDTTEKTQNSSNTSSSHKTKDESMDHVKIKIKRKSDQSHQGSISGQKGNLHFQGSKKIKKQKLPGLSVPAGTTVDGRRKVTSGGDKFKESLRRTKSEDISNSGGKRVIKYRVRRYKLLEEVVCSQRVVIQ